ncbi:hypothetical protein HWV62_28017 [Athelia sp. TMB]|nr:hypothetical protein HWV62_28017 [Athelia sp. TMB]
MAWGAPARSSVVERVKQSAGAPRRTERTKAHHDTHDVDHTTKQGRAMASGAIDVRRRYKRIPKEQQHDIWDILPSHSNHVPGKLELCVGMPVMIRYNEATECCITKGAEATVVGWDAGSESHGMPVLDTLFVELKNPPIAVQIEGLPSNIVPISRRQDDVVCTLMNGEKLAITRSQVPILINFAMTDYSSQGRTRPDNPVDLQNCRSHLSYYTALSRSATSDGTIIVQGFDKRHIQGGASGYLRQEFRELELLDEITKQMFEGILPKDFGGGTRNVLIKRFREKHGEHYMPPSVHRSIAWSPLNPFRMNSSPQSAHWQFSAKAKHVGKDKLSRKAHVKAVYVPAAGSVPVERRVAATVKRKADSSEGAMAARKKQRVETGVLSAQESAPYGFIWDSENWSCCYDSLLTILMCIWLDNPKIWMTAFRKLSPEMKALSDSFRRVRNDDIDVETARDRLRMMLNAADPESFPYGEMGGRIHVLADILGVAHTDVQLQVTYCRQCGKEKSLEVPVRVCIDCPDSSQSSSQAFLDNHMLHPALGACDNCTANCYEEIRYKEAADMLFFNIGDTDLRVNKILRVRGKSKARMLVLRGIVYSDGKHYTARVFDTANKMWYHDGMINGGNCIPDGDFNVVDEGELSKRGGAKAVVAVYAKRSKG